MGGQYSAFAVIADLIRNLLSEKDTLEYWRWRMFLRHDGKALV